MRDGGAEGLHLPRCEQARASRGEISQRERAESDTSELLEHLADLELRKQLPVVGGGERLDRR